jgi:hypothetical protein
MQAGEADGQTPGKITSEFGCCQNRRRFLPLAPRACMSDEAETIARYRDHAGALRTIAKDAKDAQMRMALVTLADDFERMAEGGMQAPAGRGSPDRHW